MICFSFWARKKNTSTDDFLQLNSIKLYHESFFVWNDGRRICRFFTSYLQGGSDRSKYSPLATGTALQRFFLFMFVIKKKHNKILIYFLWLQLKDLRLFKILIPGLLFDENFFPSWQLENGIFQTSSWLVMTINAYQIHIYVFLNCSVRLNTWNFK